MFLGSFRLLAVLCLSFSILAEGKVKKSNADAEPKLTMIQQALKSIEVDPKSQVKHESSPQNTGVLVLKAPALNVDLNPSRYPVGLHFDYFGFSGTTITGNNYQYNLENFSSSIVPSIKFGKIPHTPIYFDEYALQIGYFRRPVTYNSDSSLTLTHASVKVSGDNVFYKHSNWDFKYSLELGLLQSQISSSQNSLSNVQRKMGTAGLGIHSQVHLKESILADVGLVYRQGFASSADYAIDPLSLGTGISYIW